MEYRIKEENKEFTIEGKQYIITIKGYFFNKRRETKEVWRRVDLKGNLEFNIINTRHICFKIPQMFKVFDNLEDAKKEIERLENEPKYYY
jgi:hypothetical protein